MNDKTVHNRLTSKVRPAIIFFIAFELVMLFQTSYSRWGTIVTGILSCLIVFACLVESYRIKINTVDILLVVYCLLISLTSLIYDGLSSGLFHLLTYSLLFILLSSLELSEREVRWIVNGYIFTSFMYSILIIIYRIGSAAASIHSRIEIFGSRLDPNYIGLPLVVSFSLVFFDFLFKKHNFYRLIVLVVIAIAIILTSSRGNFLSMSLCIMLCVLSFLKSSNFSLSKRLFVVLLVLVMIAVVYLISNNNYGLFVQRIIHFEGEDISNGRFRLWSKAIEIWWERPIFGGGLETLSRTINYGAHNTYFQLLCDSGIIGFFVLVSFFIVILRKSLVLDKRLFIALVGLFIHSFFLGAITSRCFWVTLIMVNIVLLSNVYSKTEYTN